MPRCHLCGKELPNVENGEPIYNFTRENAVYTLDLHGPVVYPGDFSGPIIHNFSVKLCYDCAKKLRGKLF